MSSRINKLSVVLSPLYLSVSFVVSLVVAISSSVDPGGNVRWLVSLAKAVLLFPMLMCVFYVFNIIQTRETVQSDKHPMTNRKSEDAELHGEYFSKRVLKRALIIMACWIPYAVLLYPGVVTFDTSFQLCQFFGNEMPGIFPVPEGYAFTDHHPIMVTLLFGCIVSIGKLLGSFNVGFFLVCLFIAGLTAVAMSMAVTTLERYGLRRCYTLFLMFFFAVFPLFPFMVMTPSKDSLSAPLFLMFALFVIEIVISRGQRLNNRRFLLALLLLVIALPLSKKTGVYIVLLVCAVLACAVESNKLKILFAGASSFVVCSLLIPSMLFPALNVAKGSKIEMFGPLYQQTARYVALYGDEIGESDRASIDAVLGYETLGSRYNFTIVDTVIHAYDDVNLNPSMSELLDYLKTYLSLGLKHPAAYIESFVSLEKGWFDVNERMMFAEGDGLQLDPPNGEPSIERSPVGQKLAGHIREIATWVANIPGLNLLFLPALYTIIVPAACLLLLRKKKMYSILLPLGASILFLLLSPVSLCSSNIEAMRYLLPFVYIVPVYICVALCADQLKRGVL